jgi:hypothetical protein
MSPAKPIPFQDDFKTADEYVDSLLKFSAASTIFQTLCGGVHILDFFTQTPSLYHKVVPEEWRSWLMTCESMELLDFLMRDDLEVPRHDTPPESLIKYIKDIRKHSLQRNLPAGTEGDTKLPRQVSVGMIPKKIHEVSRFADYAVQVANDASARSGKEITHFVDFGSGQNYLGRTLACPPYNKHIVAVESKELNINGAKRMDVFAGVGVREKVMRNKKVFRQIQESQKPADSLKKEERLGGANLQLLATKGVDLRPIKDLATIYTPAEGKGYMQYVEHRVEDGDLSNVVSQIEKLKLEAPSGKLQLTNAGSGNPDLPDVLKEISKEEEIRLMAISIHSCGNLSHHGIRSLILNPTVQAVAIVGCCYNLLTSCLGPSTLKHPHIRRNLKPINAPHHNKDLPENDPHGFPMSQRLAKYDGDGVRLNITARMMGVQAPQNWTEKESESFFTRHFYRAMLQKMFLDYGVVKRLEQDENGPESTEPVIIGSLRKGCYVSFPSYVRGAIEKLKVDPERALNLDEKMGGITDEEFDEYGKHNDQLKKELSVTWSLMAFSAGVVESLIVVDRWLYLKEYGDLVRDCWVEPVFDYKQSPRNLVVVGIKR